MRLVAQAFGKLGLPVEAQPVIAAPGDEMQMAAHRPQEVLALLEELSSSREKTPLSASSSGRVGAVEEFGDPEQRVQIAQAALAVLDVGLDEIAAFARS